MKKKLIFAAVITSTLLFACKKENTEPQTGTPKIKQMTYMNGMAVTYEYDKNGYRKGGTVTTGSRSENVVTANSVQETFYNPNGTIAQIDSYTLGADQRVITATNNNAPGYTTDYTYNSDGQVATRFRSFNGTLQRKEYIIYVDGNMVTDSLVEGATWSLSKYEYYTDKLNTIANENLGTSYYGKSSRNMVKKVTDTFSSSPTHIYEYSVPVTDAKGRIVQQSYTRDGIPSENYTYTYY